MPTQPSTTELQKPQLGIQRVAVLPSVENLISNTVYFVKGATSTTMELVMVGSSTNEVRHVINQAEIAQMIANSVAEFSKPRVVAGIAERDALVLTTNTLVMVKDATGDGTVTSGAALYFYDTDATLPADVWTKVSEYESLDVVMRWENIVGRPTASAADIDDAVSKRHTHANLADLDLIGTSAEGFLMHNGITYNRKAVIDVAEW